MVNRKNNGPAGQTRIVHTPAGEILYCLIRKRVKNLNLRIRPDGTVWVSVPTACPAWRADGLVEQKWEWIAAAQARLTERKAAVPHLPDRETCRVWLERALLRMWPAVRGLGVPLPALKVRRMRSQWGNCHWAQGYITLNLALAACPEELQDYVALHELVHFLHHDHGAGFYGKMDDLMPDWRQRRQALKGFSHILTDGEPGRDWPTVPLK